MLHFEELEELIRKESASMFLILNKKSYLYFYEPSLPKKKVHIEVETGFHRTGFD
jgi:alanine racemase